MVLFITIKYINTPGSPEQNEANSSQDLLVELQSRTKNVVGGIDGLLQVGALEDETDRTLVVAARAFIENPSENLAEIMNHTTNIGQVLAGYEMQGADAAPAIHAMNAFLFALQCVNRINYVEGWRDNFRTSSSDTQPSTEPALNLAMAQALDWATILSNGYKDDTMLNAVHDLQSRLKS